MLAELGRLEGVEEYVTTSGGSISTGMFLAGVGIEDLRTMCQAITNTEDVMDYDVPKFMKRFGLIKGDFVFTVIEKVIRARTGLPEAFNFEQFRAHTGKRMVICSYCVDDAMIKFFDADKTPGVSVVDAMRMSCSIPFFFQACEFEGKMFVDGAVCEYTQLSHIPPSERETTIVIKTGGNERSPSKPKNLMEFASAVYNAMHPCYRDFMITLFPNRFELNDNVHGERPLNPIKGIKDIELIEAYYRSGKEQTREIIFPRGP